MNKYSDGKMIGYLIRDSLKIEWMRYNMYREDDIYASAPMLVFRICVEEKEDKVTYLKKCISDYDGFNRWRLFINPLTNNKNYILSLDVVEKMYFDYSEGLIEELNLKTLVGETEYKRICETAIQDIPKLKCYLEKSFMKNE